MAEPWVTIIGLGEDGRAGLGAESQAALDAADVIMGPPRHLALLGPTPARQIDWPVPFADGLDTLESLRGQRVAVLASGDPFWFGAGTVIARHLARHEWRALPGPSCFSLAAAEMGWPLETTRCIGLHAAPFSRLRRDLSHGARVIVTLRDGGAVAPLCAYLSKSGFGDSTLTVLERLGSPRIQATTVRADAAAGDGFAHPLVAAIDVAAVDGASSAALPVTTGLRDDVFDHDGQITKRPIRAITLSTLAPRAGEHLWDVGAGSGSVALEWLLAHPTTRATAIEARPDRAARIGANADALGVADRLTVVEGAAPDVLATLAARAAAPDAIFVGGGLSEDLLAAVTRIGVRCVINAVTLEGEALLAQAQLAHGGDLMRLEISSSAPLGPKRGWKAAYPVVQWSMIP